MTKATTPKAKKRAASKPKAQKAASPKRASLKGAEKVIAKASPSVFVDEKHAEILLNEGAAQFDARDDSKRADQAQSGPHRWKKGESGNPGGMPKGMGEVKKLARQYTADAIKCLVDIMSDNDKPSASRVSAATALLDRGYGRPVQQLEVGKPGDFSDMQEHEIDAFISKASRELAHLHAAEASGVMH